MSRDKVDANEIIDFKNEGGILNSDIMKALEDIDYDLTQVDLDSATPDDLNSESRFLESVKLVKDYNGAADGKLIIDMSLHAEYTNTEQMTRFIAEYTGENNLGY